MENDRKLKCTDCSSGLNLRVWFDGCDCDSVKGEGSGFNYEIVLQCVGCSRLYPIGRVKNDFDFSENIENRRPYGEDSQEQTKKQIALTKKFSKNERDLIETLRYRPDLWDRVIKALPPETSYMKGGAA